MVVSLGFAVGLLMFSTRLGGGRRETSDVDATMLGVCLFVAFWGFAPWAALEAVGGRWGFAAAALGGLYLAVSPMALCFNGWGQLVGTSWGLYLSWLFGYWREAGALFDWMYAIDLAGMEAFDSFVVAVLSLLGIAVQGLITVAIPTIAAYLAADRITVGCRRYCARCGHRTVHMAFIQKMQVLSGVARRAVP